MDKPCKGLSADNDVFGVWESNPGKLLGYGSGRPGLALLPSTVPAARQRTQRVVQFFFWLAFAGHSCQFVLHIPNFQNVILKKCFIKIIRRIKVSKEFVASAQKNCASFENEFYLHAVYLSFELFLFQQKKSRKKRMFDCEWNLFETCLCDPRWKCVIEWSRIALGPNWAFSWCFWSLPMKWHIQYLAPVNSLKPNLSIFMVHRIFLPESSP